MFTFSRAATDAEEPLLIYSLLRSSSVRPEFAAAVDDFVKRGERGELLDFPRHLPMLKIERALCQLLESHPDWAVQRVRIEGVSGCSDFTGTMFVWTSGEGREGQKHRIEFKWDCRWKASEQGWVDFFGYPDQRRAAQEFGHRCFERWDEGVAESGWAERSF